MNEKLIKTIVLKNGLTLEIYDQSRKIAGDRWLVKMAAKIDIPVDCLHLGNGLNKQVSLNSLKRSFDNFLRYEQKGERNFVGDQQKDTVFNDYKYPRISFTPKFCGALRRKRAFTATARENMVSGRNKA